MRDLDHPHISSLFSAFGSSEKRKHENLRLFLCSISLNSTTMKLCQRDTDIR